MNKSSRIVPLLATLTLAACGGAGPSSIPAGTSTTSNASASNTSGVPSAASTAGIAKQYGLIDLGTGLPGSPGLVPASVSDSGIVAGEASGPILGSLPSCVSSACGPPRGFSYSSGVLRVLPARPGDTVTFANSVNAAGVIAGGSAGATIEHAVLWNPDGSIVDLGTGIAPLNSSAEASAISNSGKIDGLSYNATANVPTFFDGKGGAFNPCGATVQGYFRGIDNAGTGVGDQILAAGGTAAMTCAPFTVVETPPNPATLDFGFGVNDSGVVVGRLETGPTNATFHPFVKRNGVTTDLGTPLFPGSTKAVGAAFAVNEAGTVVGYVAAGGAVIGKPPVPPVNPRAFIYADGKMADLNSLLVPGCADWQLVTATSINASGQIVGAAFVGGYPNGVEHGYLLGPLK